MNKQDILKQIEWHLEETEGENASGTFDQGYKEGCYHCEALLEQLDEPQDEKVEAHLAEHWDEDTGDVLWWNFPVEEPPYCGTPLDEHFPKYKTHFTTIDMPNEIEKPKQWVVKRADSDYITSFNQSLLNVNIDVTSSLDCASYYKFTDLKKAEAVATLVDGSVEEV